MSNTREAKIRQLILREFRANRTVEQAYKNIRFVLGPLSITRKAVSHWFQNFKNGQTKIFPDNFNEANLNLISDESLAKTSKAMLACLEEERNFQGFATDGRMHYAMEYNRENHQQALVVTDLFHAKSKSIFFSEFSSVYLKMIDNEHFLLFEFSSSRLSLLKLDHDNWTMEILHSVIIANLHFDQFLLDQKDNQKFVMAGYFVLQGEIQDNRIVLGTRKRNINNEGTYGISYTKLDDNKLCTIKQVFEAHQPQENVHIYGPEFNWHYCETNLETMIENNQTIPMQFSNGQTIQGINFSNNYSWSGNRLYVVNRLSPPQVKIVSFDVDTRMWFDVGISFLDSVFHIFIDSEQQLTVKTFGANLQRVFYRFALKKPDKLSNIAFLSMARKFKWDAPQMYKQMIQYIPLNNSLQCQVPVENVDDQEEVNN